MCGFFTLSASASRHTLPGVFWLFSDRFRDPAAVLDPRAGGSRIGSACRFPVFPDRSAVIGAPAPKIKKPALYREKAQAGVFLPFFIPAFFNFL